MAENPYEDYVPGGESEENPGVDPGVEEQLSEESEVDTPQTEGEAAAAAATAQYEQEIADATKNILDQTPSQKAAIDQKTGKKLPVAPKSGKRFIRIHAKQDYWTPTSSNYRTVIEMVQQPDGVNSASFDEATYIEDITADLLAGIAVYNGFGYLRQTLEYNSTQVQNLAVIPVGASLRQIRVTFASGHVELFEILLPLNHTSNLWCHTSNNSSQGTGTNSIRDCFPGNHHRPFKDMNAFRYWYNPCYDQNYFTKFNVLDDAGGQLHPVEWALKNKTLTAQHDSRPDWTYCGNQGFAPGGATPANWRIWNPDGLVAGRQKMSWVTMMGQEGLNDGLSGVGTGDFNGVNCEDFYSQHSSVTGGVVIGANYSVYDGHSSGQDSMGEANYNSIITFLDNNPNATCSSGAWYAENLVDCTIVPTTTYDVCTDPGDPLNYLISPHTDCNGATIPSADLPGGANHPNVVFNSTACCTGCTIESQFNVSCASNGAQDGLIRVSQTNPAFTGSCLTTTGTPWTSGSMYTYNLTLNTGGSIAHTMPPAGGATTTVASCVTVNLSDTITCPSSSLITQGMQITGTNVPSGSYIGNISAGSIGNNVTEFQIVDCFGAPAYCTGGATNTMTVSAGHTLTFGNLLPNTAGGAGATSWYILRVTDNDGCFIEHTITICENPPRPGCTDNTAVNYDATAQVMCTPPCCIECDDATGELTDPGAAYTGQLFDTTTATPTSATWGGSSHNSDGTIAVTASVLATATAYMDFNSTETFTFTLFSTPTYGSIVSATQVAQQTGIAATTYGSTPAHTFTSLAYGHYAIKVEFEDSDSGSDTGLEKCYTYFYTSVLAKVCDDPTALNYSSFVGIPNNLKDPDNSLCTYNVLCCNLGTLNIDISGTQGGTFCEPVLWAHIGCDPGTVSTTGYWEFNGGLITNSSFSLGSLGSTDIIGIDSTGANMASLNGTGQYEIFVTATYANGQTCNTGTVINYTAPIWGCMDPNASNYDPTAVCDDGSCIYPSWNCVGNCSCVDPGTGLGTYSDYNTCMANCPCIIPGCTDPCATNYDPAANQDDGSCIFRACIDPTALNQYWSCDCNQSMPSPVNPHQSDPNCCTYCQPSIINNLTTYAASQVTGTCATSNDGGFSFTMHHPTCNSLRYQTYDSSGTPVGGGTLAAGGACITYSMTPLVALAISESSLHPAGVYTVVVEECCNGCQHSFNVVVPGTVDICGCTDPAASNYDPSATIDDGTCLYCGCTDPLAWNYDPNAACDDGSCRYPNFENPCLPPSRKDLLWKVNNCLSKVGTEWLFKYKIGTDDECLMLNKWKLILLQYVLDRGKGLDCVYNCEDEGTHHLKTLLDCDSILQAGGPVTGLSDQGHAGSTWSNYGGTIIADPSLYFVQSNTLYNGDVIRMPSGLVWEVISQTPCSFGCGNPETASGAKSNNWKQCKNPNLPQYTVGGPNYYDIFSNFVNKYCDECNIPLPSGRTSDGGAVNW